MHRDVTVRNMLLVPGNPPFGVLSDFGKAVEQEWATEARIGPAYSQAPEVTGHTRYTKAIDVFSGGLAFANILITRNHQLTFAETRPTQKNMGQPEMIRCLHSIGRQSQTHRQVTNIVKDMLAANTLHRPQIGTVIGRWSNFVSLRTFRAGKGNGITAISAMAPTVSTSLENVTIARKLAGKQDRRQDKPRNFGVQHAGSRSFAEELLGATPNLNIRKMMRDGGGGRGFTAVKKPIQPQRPFLVRHCEAPTSERESEVLNLGDGEKPLEGAGIKRTWEDRDSQGPESVEETRMMARKKLAANEDFSKSN